jgi:chemotaxis protein CheC
MEENTKLLRAIKLVAQLSVDTSSRLLSKMIKAAARISIDKTYMAEVSEVTAKIATDVDEVAGAFIDLVGEMPFKFLFFVRVEDSLLLTDMILQRTPGSTKEFNVYAQSAVQEIGNILSSAISNIFSKDFNIALKPTPPVVIRDYAGVVFSEYLLNVAAQENEIFIVETVFNVIEKNIDCYMFLLPAGDKKILEKHLTE